MPNVREVQQVAPGYKLIRYPDYERHTSDAWPEPVRTRKVTADGIAISIFLVGWLAFVGWFIWRLYRWMGRM